MIISIHIHIPAVFWITKPGEIVWSVGFRMSRYDRIGDF